MSEWEEFDANLKGGGVGKFGLTHLDMCSAVIDV